MDGPESEKKRLKHITEHLEELRRLDMVKSLGDRNMAATVLNIFRYLNLGQIWEVIAHSLPLRRWLHQSNVWEALARERVDSAELELMIQRIKNLSGARGINYFWVCLAADAYAVKTARGGIIRLAYDEIADDEERLETNNTKLGKLIFEVANDIDVDVFRAVNRAFPESYTIQCWKEMFPNIKIQRSDKSVFATRASLKAAIGTFFYIVLTQGGSVLQFSISERWVWPDSGLHEDVPPIAVLNLFLEGDSASKRYEGFFDTFAFIRTDAFHYY